MMSPADTSELSDEALAVACDLEALHARYCRRLPPFIARYGVPRHELDDVVQQLWIRVWNHLQKTPFQGHFRGWLFRIAERLAIDYRRRKKTETLPEDESSLMQGDVLPPDEILIESEEMQQLQRCFTKLDEERSDIVRSRLSGEGYDEICVRRKLSRERAYSLFHKAWDVLLTCMGRAKS
jgi:RNA polymerase sigma-70 factor (ECF subfamily)